MEKELNILLVEDNEADSRLIEIFLRDVYPGKHKVKICKFLSEAIDALAKNKYSVAILDLGLPDSSGIETFFQFYKHATEVPVVVLTGLDDDAIGLAAIQHGAQNFTSKNNLDSKILKRTIDYSVERFRLLQELSEKTKKLEDTAAEVIREKNKLYEAQKLAHIGNWEWEIGTKAISWSDEMYRIYGLEPQSVKITYEEYAKRVHPDDRELLETVLWKGYHRKQEFKVFIKIVHDNGMVRIVLMQGAVLPDEFGNPKKMYGTAQDITEMKQLEEALQKSKRELEMKVEERTADLNTAVKNLEREINERSRMQQELKQEKEKLQRYLKVAKVVFLVLDRDFKVKLVNKKGCEITGYSEKELLGRSWLEIVPESHKSAVQRIFTLLLSGAQDGVEFFENPVITKNGGQKLIAWHNTFVKNGSGDITGILSSGEDITEKKAAEKALKKSEEKYRKLVENMDEGIVVVDNEDTIQFLNNKFCKMLGYSEKELLGQKAYKVLLEENGKKLMHERIKRRVKGITDKYELKITAKDGSAIWVLVSATPVYDEAGNVVGSMGIHTDITVRKKYEDEISKLSLALSNSENSIVITDSEGKIEWVNRGFERLTGYMLEEVKGTSGEVLRKGNATGISKSTGYFKQLVKEKKSVSYESHNYSKEGKEYWMFTTLTPIVNETGKIQKIIAVDSDITHRKKIEKELMKAKQIAEESARAKETFLANMSHEIRTPMNAIMGIIQLMQDSELSKEQKQYLRNINFAADSLLRILNDILELSKIGSGKLNFQEIVFNPAEIVNGLVSAWSYNAREKNISLSVQLDKNIPEQLIGDPVRLNQMLGNLLTNAIKFTAKGSVTVSGKVLKKFKNKVKICFEVEDTGIGIPKEKQKLIFKEFEQADADTSRKYGGTGLGLAIVKRLADFQGGKVFVQSKEGKGALFSFALEFKLPLKKQVIKQIKEAHKITGNLLDGLKVLLVEDNDLNQMVAGQFLKHWGVTADIASDGKEAINIMKEKNYSLVLMDIQMPNMNGYETTAYIRKNFKGEKQKVPILAMTAHAFSDEEKKCLNAGMNGYISKPINREMLYEKICSLVQKNNGSIV